MTPQELKNSILQLAIQGKLVEQRPEEGTAEELYRQIQAEKQALIKAGKIKKEKPLPEITEDEVPFEIPESWKWVYVGDIFLHNTGKAQNSAGSTAGITRKFITTSNLYWNRFDFSHIKEMPFTEKEIERCSVRKGDLLVCEGGDCGRSAIWNYDEEVCIQNHVHRLRPYLSVVIEYFYHLFYLYKFTNRLQGRGVGIKGLSSEAIHIVVIPLPPLAEQKRIVAKVEELLPYIDRYEKAWSRLKDFNKRFPVDMQKSILQLAIQGKLVEQRPEEGTGEELYRQIQAEKQALVKAGKIKKGKPLPEIAEDEVPFEIPKSWKWVRLSNVSAMCLGKMLDRQKNKGENRPYLRNVNVRWGDFDLTDLLEMKFDDVGDERFLVRKGDIVMCEGGEPGRCAVWNDEEAIHFQKALHRIRLYGKLSSEFYQKLFFHFAKSGYLSSFFTGTTIKHLTGQALEKVVVPLPPLAEQKRIVAKLEELLPLCERLK